MKYMVLVSGGLLLVAVVAACGGAEPTATPAPTSTPAPPSAKAELRNAQGENVGSATITETKGGITVAAEASNLPPGFHGFHVHAVGKCEAPDFTSAGGHFNPPGQSHPGHVGDMPILLVNADGTGEARFKTDRYALASLFDPDGSALIVHANPDNYANIPTRYGTPDAATLGTGDAGARIACGLITR